MTPAESRLREAVENGYPHHTLTIEDGCALVVEIDRLRQWEVAGREWLDKTDWMQNKDAPVRWLGKHRADALREEIDRLTRERDEARAELERERMRLAACGVVAMSNTPESAKRNREMHADYHSASCDDVASAVDREMELRAEREAMANVLPGYYYMDPPDGGDVPVLEQLRRMAKDAERYRHLRDDGSGFEITVREEDEDGAETWVSGYPPREMDAAIDAQIEQERSEQAKERAA